MLQLDSDLWVTETPLRFLGVEVGARMTVVRLPSSKLLLHSPVAASEELVREVQALGSVAYLVAPNLLHHLFVGEWKQACPDASIHVAPGLDAKRADLAADSVLSNEPEAGWEGTLDQIVMDGFPFANEVVFFHRPSATLFLTDLAFNLGAAEPPLTRAFIRLAGTYGRVSPTLLERILVRDRKAFRASLERIFEWPFERVIVSHGEVSESGGREELASGYAWALGK
jgi:hypothetical protein